MVRLPFFRLDFFEKQKEAILMQNMSSEIKISVMVNKGPLIFSSPISFSCDLIWLVKAQKLRGAIKKTVLEVTLNGTNTCLYCH